MSNLKAIAHLEDAITQLTHVRDEMQARHDRTVAALAEYDKAKRTFAPVAALLRDIQQDAARLLSKLFRR